MIAGLTVWAVLIPESLAYATIAGVPSSASWISSWRPCHSANAAIAALEAQRRDDACVGSDQRGVGLAIARELACVTLLQ